MGNVAVLWDIQNVAPSKDSVKILIDGLFSYCDNFGNRAYMYAAGDWGAKNMSNKTAVALSESGFELSYIPQVDEKGKQTKDSVDFILMTKATEMIFQYPHIQTYVIITGDVDFRPLVLLLKKHGKTVNIIYNNDTVSERLLEFADDHKDYRDLLPDETDKFSEDGDDVILKKDKAFNLLVEAISQMTQQKKVATPGSVKVRMKMINSNFAGIEGVKNWLDFIDEAANKKYIVLENKDSSLVLSINKKSKNRLKSSKDIFAILTKTMKSLNGAERWIPFTEINKKLVDENIKIKDYNYNKFKKLALDAQSKGLIEITTKGLSWHARLKSK